MFDDRKKNNKMITMIETLKKEGGKKILKTFLKGKRAYSNPKIKQGMLDGSVIIA